MPSDTATELGTLSRMDAIERAVGPLAGKTVIDIGCGEGAVAKALAARGAIVTGYDPFIPSVERVRHGPGSYALLHATADEIPEPDASADLVLFMFSLHHVPAAQQAAALAEAKRLVKPDGHLCVAEPLAEGPGQYVMELYHDETAVRKGALEALKAHAAPVFSSERVLYFSEARTFADYDAYVAQALSNMRFNGYTEAAVTSPEVKRRFDAMFALHGGAMDQRVRINLFTP